MHAKHLGRKFSTLLLENSYNTSNNGDNLTEGCKQNVTFNVLLARICEANQV